MDMKMKCLQKYEKMNMDRKDFQGNKFFNPLIASVTLIQKPIDWFLQEKGIGHERVETKLG